MKFSLNKNNSKVAIICLGQSIDFLNKNINVRCVDLLYLKRYLEELGREVDFVSRGKTISKNIVDVDLNDYDEVYIYNSSYNVFGGKFHKTSLDTFSKLCDFNGEVYYVLADPAMPCKDFSLLINKIRSYNDGKIPLQGTHEFYDLDLTKLDKWNEIYSKIKVCFTGVDFDKYYELWVKTHKSPFTAINHSDWCELPLFSFYAVQEDLGLKLKSYDFSSKKYDLVYYGNKRNSSSRNKIIKQLYDYSGFSCQFIGYDPEFECSKVEVFDYVSHGSLFPKICESYCSVIVGDKLHNDNIITPRFFESMLLDVVGLIYDEYDSEHKIIQNPELRDFIYVKSVADVEARLSQVRNDEKLYRRIVELEREEVMRICKGFISRQ